MPNSSSFQEVLWTSEVLGRFCTGNGCAVRPMCPGRLRDVMVGCRPMFVSEACPHRSTRHTESETGLGECWCPNSAADLFASIACRGSFAMLRQWRSLPTFQSTLTLGRTTETPPRRQFFQQHFNAVFSSSQACRFKEKRHISLSSPSRQPRVTPRHSNHEGPQAFGLFASSPASSRRPSSRLRSRRSSLTLARTLPHPQTNSMTSPCRKTPGAPRMSTADVVPGGATDIPKVKVRVSYRGNLWSPQPLPLDH
ncbi:hypothetical protein N657DRAFT_30905 [Parathielavia appendiculata]|uniref:Uncharacterized protein n=1 Tax=Parathielavia appendiculata TaxID=2587402 RepID=A0AAN6U999_9PEZI|nr:hypothetical protein N657DRAFT_30905 [Parathielavia appendiculata]